MTAKLVVQGDKELIRALNQFPKKFVNKSLRKALRDAMKRFVLVQARDRAARLSGALKRSIKVKTARRNNGGKLPRHMLGIAVTIPESIRYAKWVLFDRRLRSGAIRPGDRTLRDALFENQLELKTSVESRMRAELPSIAAEARRGTGGTGPIE